MLVGFLICAAVASVAYAVLGHALGSGRAALDSLDDPVSDDPTTIVFRVEPGDTASAIGASLERQGLIRSARAFRMLVERDGVGQRLAAGEYEISPSMSTPEIIEVLASGRVRRGLAVTVPEGWRAEEIAWKLDAIAAGSGTAFLEQVYETGPAPDGVVLPPNASLEGFLFPETYEWRPESGVETLVTQMVAQFGRVFDQRRRERAAQVGLSVFEAVVLASIVEREAAIPDERPLIAGVFRNRLLVGMPLQADPTVQFAIARPRVPAPTPVLWKRELDRADLEAPSPYNTYRRSGLPAGPICSPGQASLDAALQPAVTDAYYFVAREDGSHVFARTLQEHNENVRRYQQMPRY
jgi:UPF0755 protein